MTMKDKDSDQDKDKDKDITELLKSLNAEWVAVSFKKIEWTDILISMANTYVSAVQFRTQAKAAGDTKKVEMFETKILETLRLIGKLQAQVGVDDKMMHLLMRKCVRVEFFNHYFSGTKISEN